MTSICLQTAAGQSFAHPGINQTKADLAHMKAQVLKGQEPYKSAFERLKEETDLAFVVTPYTHVLRGPYGKPNIGGNDLSKGAQMAYNCAVVWYITNDQAYANKSIEILDAWSARLWDFDYNDAKLLAAWTGHVLCNAAEILRYTPSGWSPQGVDQFKHLMMTVYYPLLRYYFPQANGNWDGAIIHSILAIAVFTDNRPMFNQALDHLLRGPVNGSLFKYIYPSGQCQETGRDQAHVQLGLGEFAGAAQIAYTQGVDVFSMGDHRLALGYEYTAQFLLGEPPHSYGEISQRAKKLRDDYEYIYQHYAARGIELSYTKMAADSVRSTASRSVLTSLRKPLGKVVGYSTGPAVSSIGYIAGAVATASTKIPDTAIRVQPGESIQEALNTAAGSGRWVVATAGLHTLPTTLKIPSGVTLAGEGVETMLFLDPKSDERDAIVSASDDLHDVTLRDFVLEGATRAEPGSDPNTRRSFRSTAKRGGVLFISPRRGGMKNLNFINLTVQNCTYNGVLVSGATNVSVTACDFTENGSYVVPGPKLQHNLLLTYCDKVSIEGSRLDTSPFGSGLSLGHCRDVRVTHTEIARNGYYGVLIAESENVVIEKSLIEANDRSGVMMEFLDKGSKGITVRDNRIQYNNGFGVESYATKNGTVKGNLYEGNGLAGQEKISAERRVIME
ncbi:right-handed parallel beta-helix repeat-containing protein [Persicitalea sp.]|uniref:right-handed parallel beta-helix repeat-containing protein n=1 Tax=Persicitalea sp. TaxID=3100273 RepID=UPI0035940BF3